MKDYKKHLPWVIRGIIAFLFLLSAVAKLYPSVNFGLANLEFNQLYPMGFSEMKAAYFSRILIGIEFALGILILQNNYLKRLIIPATFLLLAVFTTHLFYVTYLTGGNTGNCGCFGSLLPMTPIEAIIKNVIAMVLLVILFKKLPIENNEKQNFWILTSVVLGFILLLFMLAPIAKKTESNYTITPVENISIDSTSATVIAPIDDAKIENKIEIVPQENEVKPVSIVVAKAKSGYANHFSNIDDGKQVLCFFAPGCDHCRATAKELTEMRKADASFPKMQILFMDEESNLIPEFFQFAGAEYPYKVIDIIGFWKLLGTGKQVPGVKYINDGKVIKYYFGTDGAEKFNAENFKNLIQ